MLLLEEARMEAQAIFSVYWNIIYYATQMSMYCPSVKAYIYTARETSE